MCCIFTCCVWTLDLIQRVLTFLLACILAGMVVLILTVAIVVGIAYGYNYSMAEFITLGKSDVTVYMRRGQFSDHEDTDHDRPPLLVQRRQFEDVLPEGSAFDINKLTRDTAGEAPELADSWAQAKEARQYDSILRKFTARRVNPKKVILSSLLPHEHVINKNELVFFDEENQNNDNIHTESITSKKVSIKITTDFPLTGRRIMEKFKPVYIKEDNKEKHHSQIETTKSDKVATKTTKRWSSTEHTRTNHFKTIFFEEKAREKYNYYNKTTKLKEETVETTKKEEELDTKIKIGGILGQNPDENDGYSEIEEEDKIVEAIQEETNRLHKEKTQQTSDKIIPDVKIQVGNIDYHETSEIKKITEKTLHYTKQHKIKKPDVKILLEGKDYYELHKNNKTTIFEPQEEDYEEQEENALNERWQNFERLKFDEKATHHPYKQQQPPRANKEEDDDVTYMPV